MLHRARSRSRNMPRPRSLTARERAKTVELTAAGHEVAAGTVANRRRPYEKDGVMGLAGHQPVRKTPKYGRVDSAVVAAMRQAIKEATGGAGVHIYR